MTDKPTPAELEKMSFKEILEYIHAHMADVTEEEVLRALEEDEARERRKRSRKRSGTRAASASTRIV
ncbi:MAG: hypothetical protein ACRDHF_00430 [Tepidiformaceae bacterium]